VWAVVYLGASLAIFLAWAVVARTELRGPYASLVQEIDGTAGAPFSYRRLVADLAPPLSRVVPPAGWQRFTAFVQGESAPGRLLRRLLDFLHWPAERYPELVAGYFLIWLSMLGFLLAFRWLLALAYETPAWLGHLAALAAGVMVLGGSDTQWASYPYDIPNLFLFTLTLAAILAGRWWMLLVFALACHSKETAILLIPAYAWVNRRHWRRWPCWVVLLLMAALYAGLRLWIRERFPLGAGGAWGEPGRNARLLLLQSVYGLWWTVPAAVIAVRIWLLRRAMPRHVLVLLAGMAGVLVGAGFFKGWVEERRQYFELLPLVGLVACRWAAAELGLDRLVLTRAWPVDREMPDPPVADRPLPVSFSPARQAEEDRLPC
jgi:hypothetical protein